MNNIINFIKDKSYYFLGGTIIIIILIIIVNSCSSNFSSGSYQSLENKMVEAAKKYYAKKPDYLPKTNDGTVKVSISTLIDSELLKEIYDIKDKSKKCTGYVEVSKVDLDYSYIPFLTCAGNYEPHYLTDIIKDTKVDEYGNGVYLLGDEYIYRGGDVNNYVKFNEKVWRIIKVDSSNDIKLVLVGLSDKEKKTVSYDDAYNTEAKGSYGIVTNYLKTSIRKSLKDYYEENFTSDNKAKIVSKNLCVGSYGPDDEFSVDKECSVIKEDEKIGLLSASDYKNSSLSEECTKLSSRECNNYNYLSDDINTWLLNTVSDVSYKAFYLRSGIMSSNANKKRRINPVIYLTSKVIVSDGDGTLEKPYIIK